jgi:hypothetical protein
LPASFYGLIDCPRLEQRLISLYVDDELEVEPGCHLGYPVGPAPVVRRRHDAISAESHHSVANAGVVSRHQDSIHESGFGDPSVDVLHHGTTVDVGNGFSGETLRFVAGGNDRECPHSKTISRFATS